MVFISTTDVIPREGEREPFALPQEALVEADSGYSKSKVVGEALCCQAFERGMKGVIVRLGMVGPSAKSGDCAPTDFVSRLYTGFAHTRAFPETGAEHCTVLSLPVDVAASAIAEVAVSNANHAAFNLVSGAAPVPMTAIREQLLAFGDPFKALPIVPFSEWMELVRVDAALSLWPVLGWATKRETFPEFNSRKISFGAIRGCLSSECIAAIERGVDQEILHKSLRCLFGHKNVSCTQAADPRMVPADACPKVAPAEAEAPAEASPAEAEAPAEASPAEAAAPAEASPVEAAAPTEASPAEAAAPAEASELMKVGARTMP